MLYSYLITFVFCVVPFFILLACGFLLLTLPNHSLTALTAATSVAGPVTPSIFQRPIVLIVISLGCVFSIVLYLPINAQSLAYLQNKSFLSSCQVDTAHSLARYKNDAIRIVTLQHASRFCRIGFCALGSKA